MGPFLLLGFVTGAIVVVLFVDDSEAKIRAMIFLSGLMVGVLGARNWPTSKEDKEKH